MRNLIDECVEVEIELSNGHLVWCYFDVDDWHHPVDVHIASALRFNGLGKYGVQSLKANEVREIIPIKKFSEKFQGEVEARIQDWIDEDWQQPAPADPREEPEYHEDR